MADPVNIVEFEDTYDTYVTDLGQAMFSDEDGAMFVPFPLDTKVYNGNEHDRTSAILGLLAKVRNNEFQHDNAQSDEEKSAFMQKKLGLEEGDPLLQLALEFANPETTKFGFAYNTGGNHFAALAISIPDIGGVDIQYQNSLHGNPCPEDLRLKLQTFQQKIAHDQDFADCFTDHQVEQQDQSLLETGGKNSCPEWTAVNALSMIRHHRPADHCISREAAVQIVNEQLGHEAYKYIGHNRLAEDHSIVARLVNDKGERFVDIYAQRKGEFEYKQDENGNVKETIGSIIQENGATKYEFAGDKAIKYSQCVLSQYNTVMNDASVSEHEKIAFNEQLKEIDQNMPSLKNKL